VALTTNPAGLTDYVLGDHDVFGSSSPAAVAGCPSITVPAGSVSGLPVGVSFFGPALDRAAADRPGLSPSSRPPSTAIPPPTLPPSIR